MEQYEMFTDREVKVMMKEAAWWGFAYGLLCSITLIAGFGVIMYFMGALVFID